MKNKLKEIRKEMGLTQEQLANKAELSRTTIVAIESDTHKIDGESIAKLVKATGKTATEIFFDFDVV